MAVSAAGRQFLATSRHCFRHGYFLVAEAPPDSAFYPCRPNYSVRRSPRDGMLYRMKIAAGCITLLVAAILLGGALMDYLDDANNDSERISQEFRDIHNDAAFHDDMAAL